MPSDNNVNNYRMIDVRNKLPRHPSRKWSKRAYIDTIVVHCTAGVNQDPVATAKFHIRPGPENTLSKQGAPGIAYHDYVTVNGIVYHCNDYQDSVWHAKYYNDRSIGVVLAYPGAIRDNPKTPIRDDRPSDIQLENLQRHLTLLCLYFKVLPERVFGHRELPWMFKVLQSGSKQYKKECPGMNVDLDALRKDVTLRLQRRLAAEELYSDKIDGVFGKKSQAALNAFDPEMKLV